jgi:hypothetical protein
MAMPKGSRKNSVVKRTMEQATMGNLNAGTDPNPVQQANYELATYRAARKGISPSRQRGKKGPIPGGR